MSYKYQCVNRQAPALHTHHRLMDSWGHPGKLLDEVCLGLLVGLLQFTEMLPDVRYRRGLGEEPVHDQLVRLLFMAFYLVFF